MAKLVEIIESEFTRALGRSAAEYMPRVYIRARAGVPNWHAEFDGAAGISIFGAFLESTDRVRALYELDAPDIAELMLRRFDADRGDRNEKGPANLSGI